MGTGMRSVSFSRNRKADKTAFFSETKNRFNQFFVRQVLSLKSQVIFLFSPDLLVAMYSRWRIGFRSLPFEPNFLTETFIFTMSMAAGSFERTWVALKYSQKNSHRLVQAHHPKIVKGPRRPYYTPIHLYFSPIFFVKMVFFCSSYIVFSIIERQETRLTEKRHISRTKPVKPPQSILEESLQTPFFF